MNDYLVPSGGLTPDQAKDIVQGRVPIPNIYPHGTPVRISLELARNNYLREVENRYLRFIRLVVTGALVFIIGGVGYSSYRLGKLEKKIERNYVALEQSVDELSASFTSLGDTVKHFENSSYTSLGEISKSFEMIKHQKYQISEELKKTSEELKNARNDLRSILEELREELNNAEKDLRDTRADLESVMEPNSIK